MKPGLQNGLTLAYIGDSYYELIIRKMLLDEGITNVNFLHNKAIRYTSGISQKMIVEYLLDNQLLTEEEILIYKRGRNIHTSQNRKNISLSDYQKATGFEALIGYLYLIGKEDRVKELVDIAIKIIN